MHTLFKCEVFARDFTFRSFAPIESPEIQFDYLTIEKTTLRAVKLDAKKGDFISVTDQNGNVAYQGIVDDVETDKTGVTISAQPLMSLLTQRYISTARPLQRSSLLLLQSFEITLFLPAMLCKTYPV